MEKNMAPKWMEGTYVLEIKGNKMRLTNGNLHCCEVRCHPDDKFTIEDGIAEVFQQMYDDTMKIKVGDVVKVVDLGKVYSTYAEWVDENVHGIAKCMYQYDDAKPDTTIKYQVLAVGKHPVTSNTLMYIQEVNDDGYGKCYLMENKGLEKVKA